MAMNPMMMGQQGGMGMGPPNPMLTMQPATMQSFTVSNPRERKPGGGRKSNKMLKKK